MKLRIGRWSFSANFGRCGFGHRKCEGVFHACPAGSIALGFVVITYLRGYVIPVLYKRNFIGGKRITRAEAVAGLPTDAECETTRAKFRRKPRWVIPIIFDKKSK